MNNAIVNSRRCKIKIDQKKRGPGKEGRFEESMGMVTQDASNSAFAQNMPLASKDLFPIIGYGQLIMWSAAAHAVGGDGNS